MKDVVIIGAGHAGCEAALAVSRLGLSALLLTMNFDAIALMACNPAIGGTAKGHLVREVDAMGGEMGRAIDDTFLQSRMLNASKGPAVHSLRAQADKRAYQQRMIRALFSREDIALRQGEATEILTEGGRVCGVRLADGTKCRCRAVVVCAGVYLKSRVIMGEYLRDAGPQGLFPATELSSSLEALGFPLRRFKTGTPARMDGRTLDFSAMEPQYGDEPVVPFSFETEEPLKNRALCYLTYTNEKTHAIIRENIHRAPMFQGVIKGTGARYCPSIEDKVMRFADKDRHQVFLEPEGFDWPEWYVQGVSSSLPVEVQEQLYRTISGLENARIIRPAYAIEYDCIDARQLDRHFQARQVEGLFFAGQINGTSGYEEAAVQGLFAGANAALSLLEREPLSIGRDEGYAGVLIDDLTTKGVDEPYRMMTSRAEYRLLLRQDNADLRLTEKAWRAGLVDDDRMKALEALRAEIEKGLAAARKAILPHFAEKPQSAEALLRRQGVRYEALRAQCEELPLLSPRAAEQVEIATRYAGYLQKQEALLAQFRRMESALLPSGTDYLSLEGLRLEARQKLQAQQPASLGQAARIPGVSPGDVTVLMIWLKKQSEEA